MRIALLLIVSFIGVGASVNRVVGQKIGFSAVPAYRRCQPVEVKTASFGIQPPEALLAQVSVLNRSVKSITAVKLGWKLYPRGEGLRLSLTPCDSQPATTEVLLSGMSPLIDVVLLGADEECIVGIKPLPLVTKNGNQNTVYVEKPFISIADVNSFAAEKNLKTWEPYIFVVYVAEAQYADGTVWKGDLP